VMRKNSGPGSIDERKLAGYAFVAGVVLAPFLALIYGWNAGLGVLAFALAATTYLVVDAYRTASPDLRPRLRLLVAINAALTLVCVLLLLFRTMRRGHAEAPSIGLLVVAPLIWPHGPARH
jgi:hypothetical protein